MTAHDDLRRDATAFLAFLDRLTTEVPALISRAQIPTGRDGFPRTASGADRSSPGSAPEMPQAGTRQAETGLWGFECSCGHVSRLIYPTQLSARAVAESHLDSHAGSTLDYGDPTGDAAVARPEPDPAKARLRAVRRNLDDMLRRAQNIENILDAEKVDRDKLGLEDITEAMWCVSCKRHDVFNPVKQEQNLCEFCWSYREAHKQFPGRRVVVAHEQGNLTEAMVASDTKQRVKR